MFFCAVWALTSGGFRIVCDTFVQLTVHSWVSFTPNVRADRYVFSFSLPSWLSTMCSAGPSTFSLVAGLPRPRTHFRRTISASRDRSCSSGVFVITWHQHWSSHTGYLSKTESNTSCVHWCIKFSLGDDAYLAQLPLIAESSHRRGLSSADTADYIICRTRTKFGERCFSHAGPAAWNSLHDSIRLTYHWHQQIKNLFKTHLFHLALWHLLTTLDIL